MKERKRVWKRRTEAAYASGRQGKAAGRRFAVCFCILLISVFLCWTFLPGIQAYAAEEWESYTALTSSSSGRTLSSGSYKVTSDITCSNSSTGGNGITIASGATVTIYIARGATLTCTGKAGSSTTAGGAGIYLPSGARLYLRGEGTLSATGGNAGTASVGSAGGTGSGATNNEYTRCGWVYAGSGGRGGSGAGGAGAGIGGKGGGGASGGSGGTRSNTDIKDYQYTTGAAGGSGYTGGSGSSMGTLYVLDTVTVNAAAGRMQAVRSGGDAGSVFYYKYNYFGEIGYLVAGAGGGGGAGGIGGSPANIGGGAGGGGGGAGGGSGCILGATTSYSVTYAAYAGGSSSVGGGTGGRGSGIYQNSSGVTVSGGSGGSAGGAGSGGSGGSVYVAATASCTVPKGGSASAGDGAAAALSWLPSVTLNNQGADMAGTLKVSTYNGGTLPAITVPVKAGYEFGGYYTGINGAGIRYYDENGRALRTSGFSADGTLYARWIPLSYSIIYELEGGQNPASQPMMHTSGTATAIGQPSKEGYLFMGWEINGTGCTRELVLAADGFTADIILTAVWQQRASVSVENTIGGGWIGETETIQESANQLFLPENLVADAQKGVTAEELEEGAVEIKVGIAESPESDAQTAAERKEIADASTGEVLQYIDIGVTKYVTYSDSRVVKTGLRELPSAIRIVINLSEELRDAHGYAVYRYHEGTVDKIYEDRKSGEFFEVAPDKSKLILHVNKFSTYAVSGNYTSLGIAEGEADAVSDNAELDVQARITGDYEAVYKLDIEWGAMSFEYVADGTRWNPDTHSYDVLEQKGFKEAGFTGGNNLITVRNHSNGDVKVNFMAESLLSGVDMQVKQMNLQSAAAAGSLSLGRVPSQGAAAPEISAYLWLAGEPADKAQIEQLSAGDYVKSGRITVTVIPDGDLLTPGN